MQNSINLEYAHPFVSRMTQLCIQALRSLSEKLPMHMQLYSLFDTSIVIF